MRKRASSTPRDPEKPEIKSASTEDDMTISKSRPLDNFLSRKSYLLDPNSRFRRPREWIRWLNPTDLLKAYSGYQGVPASPLRVAADIKADVLSDPRLLRVLEKHALQHAVPESESRKQAELMYRDLAAHFSSRSLRSMEYLMHKVLKRIFNAIYVDEDGIQTIRRLVAAGQPIILMPTHKSHIDYIILSIVCFWYNLPLPYVAAGENLNMPVIGSFMKSCGAFFIRRKFDNDLIYRTLFTVYIEHLLRTEGCMLEFFVEGGRSRTGKVLPPKMGLLSVICDSVRSGVIQDAILVPVQFTYDHVVEIDSYTRELLGGSKVPETVGGVFRSTKILRLNFGSVHVSISDPISVREHLGRSVLAGANLQTMEEREFRRHVRGIGFFVLYQCNRISIACPTALVASALLTHGGRAISLRDLVRMVQQLSDMILARGGRVVGVLDAQLAGKEGGESIVEIVQRAVRALGKLVETHMLREVPYYESKMRLKLSFYKNSLLHWFVSDALVACAVYAHVRSGIATSAGDSSAWISKDVLLEDIRFISRVLRQEFIYRPSPDISENFGLAVQTLIDRGILQENPSNRSELGLVPSKVDTLLLLCSMVWPFIDSYWLFLRSVRFLEEDYEMEANAFLQRVQNYGLLLYYEGSLRSLEAVFNDTLRNALTVFSSDFRVISYRPIFGSHLHTIKRRKGSPDELGLEDISLKLDLYRRDDIPDLLTSRAEKAMSKAMKSRV